MRSPVRVYAAIRDAVGVTHAYSYWETSTVDDALKNGLYSNITRHLHPECGARVRPQDASRDAEVDCMGCLLNLVDWGDPPRGWVKSLTADDDQRVVQPRRKR